MPGFLLPTQFQLISLGCIQFLPLTALGGEWQCNASRRKSGKTYLIVVDQPLDGVADQLKTIRLVFYVAISVALLFAG